MNFMLKMYTRIYMYLRLKTTPWLARYIMIMINYRRFFYFGWKNNIIWMVKLAMKLGAKPNARILQRTLENNFEEMAVLFSKKYSLVKIVGLRNFYRKLIRGGNIKILELAHMSRTDIVNGALELGKTDLAKHFYGPEVKIHKRKACYYRTSFEFMYSVKNFPVNYSSLSAAIGNGNLDILKFLVDRGLNLKKWGPWIVRRAIFSELYTTLKYLEKIGLNLNRQCYLDTAAYNGSVVMMEWFYKKGLNLGTKKILKFAKLFCCRKITKFLLENCPKYYADKINFHDDSNHNCHR